MLVDYQHPPQFGQAKQPKVDAAPPAVREIAWKAQCRLYRRYRTLIRNGKLKTVAIVAIARELAGFIWAVARRLDRTGRGSLRGLARGAKRPRPSANQGALRRGSGPAKR